MEILETLLSAHSVTIANAIRGIAATARTEEDVRHGVNSLIDDFIKTANIQVRGSHEYALRGGRLDSKYSGVLIEYKNPKGAERLAGIDSSAGTRKVVDQLTRRFEALRNEEDVPPEKLLGVGLDGEHIVFVRSYGRTVAAEAVQQITPYNVERVLRAIVSLGAKGKSYSPANLASDFGFESDEAQRAVRDLFEVIKTTTDPKTTMFFSQWQIQFGEVCGYDVHTASPTVKTLAERYGVTLGKQSAAPLLFSIHTYYALVMKFIAAEIVTSLHPLATSTVKTCVNAPTSAALRKEISKIENEGGVWSQFGITNFLEGDLFSWYLSSWSNPVIAAVRAVISRLDQYDASTLSVDPAESRDLLKHLYHELFPREVRHNLGEYYTPDWLAEYTLDVSGFSGDPDKRFLDPSCGSGTFLVIAINRMKKWFAENRLSCGYGEAEFARKVLQNVVGFDLNPLAVLAARTNFLLSIREFLRHLNNVELPIFLCDAIVTPTEYSQLFGAAKLGEAKNLKTAAGEFVIPAEVTLNRETISSYTEELERAVRDGDDEAGFLHRCEDAGLMLQSDSLHRELFRKIKDLDTKKQNRIWARVIKNAFAPLFVERFDAVIGNPPWVNWESLPDDYRDDMKAIWQRYGLFSLSGTAGRHGGGKKDLCMLFVYACIDHYLRDGGRLAFVITQTVFKSTGAGDGFRRFRYSEGAENVYMTPVTVDDLSSIQPFEGATNRTAVVIFDKTKEPVKYPVRYRRWKKIEKGRIPQDVSLPEALARVELIELAAAPVNADILSSPWLTVSAEAIEPVRKVIGTSDYKGYEGVNSGGLNGCYWVEIQSKLRNGDLMIQNLHQIGRKKVELRQAAVEADLVYPLVRGRDVRQWVAKPSASILLVQDPQTRKGIAESELRRRQPKTLAYLKNFEAALRARALYRQYFHKEDPFWSMYNVGLYTLSDWKVVWREQSAKFQVAVLHPENNRPTIPDHKLMLVAVASRDEAYYLAGVLSSAPVRLTVESYVLSTSTSTHVLEHVRIPKYDPKDALHQSIVKQTAVCIDAALREDQSDLAMASEALDQIAAGLWDLTVRDVAVIRSALMIEEELIEADSGPDSSDEE